MSVRERIDIEAVVIWALRDQGLGWVGKERDAREDWSDYGTIIDDEHTGSHPTIGLWSDDEAMQVKMAIDQLPIECRVLIVQYGRAGLRPDWIEEGYGTVQQLTDARGRLRWIWEDPVNRTGAKRPMMGFVGEQRDNVDFHRAQYQLWWQGLADIVGPLNDVLERRYVTGPVLSRSPWCESPKGRMFGENGEEVTFSTAEAKVSEMSLEALRTLANDPIQSVATDWSVPVRPARRQKAR